MTDQHPPTETRAEFLERLEKLGIERHVAIRWWNPKGDNMIEENGPHSQVADIYIPWPPIDHALVIRRGFKGEVYTNVPHRVVHHSPTGFEFGYGGAGPADLALNICDVVMHRIFPDADHAAAQTWDGVGVARSTWAIHQDLKWREIATLDQSGAYKIPYPHVVATVRDLLAEHAESIAFAIEQDELMRKLASEDSEHERGV